jgi:hypothetical protein
VAGKSVHPEIRKLKQGRTAGHRISSKKQKCLICNPTTSSHKEDAHHSPGRNEQTNRIDRTYCKIHDLKFRSMKLNSMANIAAADAGDQVLNFVKLSSLDFKIVETP